MKKGINLLKNFLVFAVVFIAIGIFFGLVATGVIDSVKSRFWEYEIGRHVITGMVCFIIGVMTEWFGDGL